MRRLKDLWTSAHPQPAQNHRGPTTMAAVVALGFLALVPLPARAAISASQRQALVDLYNSTNGASWANKTGWSPGTAGTECNWHGITCDGATNNVLGVVLTFNNLVGTIPLSITNLTSVQELDLRGNSLTGTIPPLSAFNALQSLDLQLNQLSGSIPSLAGLTTLQHLGLSFNQLSGSIPSLAGLTSLNELYLSTNQLVGSIPSLAGLTSLQDLTVYSNQLSGSIPSLTDLTSLRGLSLYSNHLSGTLPDVTGLTTLNSLYLQGNQLSGSVPASYGNLTNLGAGTLDLRWNALYSSDSSLITFLNSKQAGGDWRSTQTIAPTNVTASPASSTAINVNWTPVLYTGDSGSYQIGCSTTSGGPYTGCGSTANKLASSLTVMGLSPNTTYYLAVITNTFPHANNQNTVVSDLSAEVSARTLGGSLPTATVSGSQSICQGQSAQLRVDLTGTPPWSLTWSDGPSQSGIPSTPFFRTVTPSSTTTYSVTTVTDATGSNSGTGSALITVNAIPSAPAITAPASAPANQTGLTASVPSNGGSTYAWTLSGSGAITSGTNSSTITFTAGASGSLTLQVTETHNGCTSPPSSKTIPITGGCATPGTPVFVVTSASVTAGQAFVARWTASSGLQADGAYTLEVSASAAFSPLIYSATTALTATQIPTSSAGTLYARVRATQGCGTASANSTTLTLRVDGAPSAFTFTSPGPAWTAVRGGAFLPSGPATVGVRNVGGQTGRVTFSLTGPNFFSFSPAFLDLGPGQEGTVSLLPTSAALQTTGVSSGSLLASSGTQGLSIPVSLTVTAAAIADGSQAGTKVTASSNRLVFSAPTGGMPSPQLLTLQISGGTGPVYLTAQSGPGNWLQLGSEIGNAVPASGNISLPVSVDRTQRTSADGYAPYRTLLKISALGSLEADAAVIEVIDAEPPPVQPGNTRSTAPVENSSFIVPVIVGSTAGDVDYQSDGWLTNVGSVAAAADLYYTPQDLNGLTDPGVLHTTLNLEAGATIRLSDPVRLTFGIGAGNGQMEIRTATPGAFALRTTVGALKAGDPTLRFGSELPTVSYGAGVGKGGDDFLVPVLENSSANRSNLILTETTGASADVKVDVYNGAAVLLGSLSASLKPYGKTQINKPVEQVKPGDPGLGAYARVRVVNGAGFVIGISTPIDNASNSFASLLGTAVPALGAVSSTLPARRPQATGVAPPWIIPAVARLNGANATIYSTTASITNFGPFPANLTITYHYINRDQGNASGLRTITLLPIPAYQTHSEPDLPGLFFTDTPTPPQTYGWMLVEGDTAAIKPTCMLRTQVDPNDVSKGYKLAEVKSIHQVSVDGTVIMTATPPTSPTSGERLSAGAAETALYRTNFNLVEIAGQPATVRVTVKDTDKNSKPVATRDYQLAPYQYFQINSFLTDQNIGAGLAFGQATDYIIHAQVTEGAGQVVSFFSKIDNISRNPLILQLNQTGLPQSGGITGH